MAKKVKTKKSNKDIQLEITSQVLTSIIEGAENWVQSWISTGRAKNFTTDKNYKGINTLLLSLACQKKDYKDNLWAGFGQISSVYMKDEDGKKIPVLDDNGEQVTKYDKASDTDKLVFKTHHVKKGEKGSQVIAFNKYMKKVTDKNGKPVKDSNGQQKTFPLFFYKYMTVFNIEQTTINVQDFLKLKEFTPIEGAENFVQAIDHELVFGGDKALYNKTDDFIQLPDRERFNTSEDYYSTHLHELAHWSGSATRLNRDHADRYETKKDQAAFEELVAELTSAYLCAEIGLQGDKLDHASYLGDWIKILQEDHTAIFKAASESQAAADYLTELATGKPVEVAEQSAA